MRWFRLGGTLESGFQPPETAENIDKIGASWDLPDLTPLGGPMYAVIKTGGKQYKVKAGDLFKVEKLDKDLGDEFELGDILFVSGNDIHVGEPTVSNSKVTVVVTQQSRARKILVFKKKRRQGYSKMNGHRQPFTELFVKSIVAPDGETEKTDKKAPVKDPSKKKDEAKKVEAKKAAPKKAGAKKKATKKKTTKKKASAKKAAPKKAE